MQASWKRVLQTAFFAAVVGDPALRAQTARVTTPGVRFVAEGRRGGFSDTGAGRHFRGEAFQTLVLSGTFQLPSNSPARLKRLVVRFRSSPHGPSLHAIELRSSGTANAHVDCLLEGDYLTREVAAPERSANVLDFGAVPQRIYPQTVLRLTVAFPGGFDSRINPGEFFLAAVDADFLPQ